MYSSAVFLVFLIFFLVKCEASTNGNLSAVNLTPRITSTTVAPGLGAYILAALGQTPTYTNTTTTAAALNSTTTTTTTTISSHHSSHVSKSTRSTVCYPAGNRCFDDIHYISPTIAPTGVGAAYATSCSNVISAYNSASNSWEDKHSYQTNYTDVLGGTSWIPITYYVNATTLCDGHARVGYSPAIATSSTTIMSVGTTPTISIGTASMGWVFPISTVSCSVNPSDCDGLWQAYSTASSKWDASANATQAVDAIFPTITPSPSLPACINSSQSMSDEAFSKSFYGCGLCTIFGDEVELMYFPEPTTVSRDMCATTPSANLTAYGKDDGMPYTAADPSATWNGSGTPPETAVVGTHTFTSGTAYISIKRVWAVNRCSSHIGTTVTGAILALPSDRLLSLRYSQNHFQYFATTDQVTGYSFNYADLNSPVPYSAWNGQARCDFPGAADYKCDVIYENQYNPQLAMPPGIRKLNPEWEGCQMWYGGLYDPPYALKPGTAVATPTVPFGKPPVKTQSAEEASTAAPTTATPTALADHTTDRADSTQGETQPINTAGQNQDTTAVQSQDGAQNTEAPQNMQAGSPNNNGGNNQDASDNNGNGQNSQGSGNNDNTQNTQGVQNNQGAQGQDNGQNTAGGQGENGNQGSPGGQTANDDQGFQGGQTAQAGQNQNGAQSTQGGQSQNAGQGNQGGQSQNGGQGNQGGQSQNEHWNPTQAVAQNTQGGQNNQGANTANGAQNTQAPQVPQAQGGSSGGSSNTPAKPRVYVFTAGTFTYTATQTNTVYVCGTNTVSVGGPAVTLPVDCVISAGTNGLVISTQAASVTNLASAVTALPVITKAVIITVGTQVQTVSEGSSGVVKIGSTRLTPGGSAVTLDDGSVVSADSEGVKVGSTIMRYSTVTPASAAGPDVVVVVVGTKSIVVSCPPGNTNQAVIGSVTLTAGGIVQTLENGSHASLASGGDLVVDGTSAATLATPASAIVFTVNGDAVTAYQAAGVSSVATIEGTIASRGGPAVTLSSGEVVSMGSKGLVVQQGSTTVPVSAFTTMSGTDDSSPSSVASGSSSKSRAASNNARSSSTRSAQQNQDSQTATASGTSGAASIIHFSTTASVITTALLISPLLFAIYL